jgi:hypothetical protein
VHQWARSWELTNTWIEEWANNAVADWNAGLLPQPLLDATTGDINVLWPQVPEQATKADHFSCTISGTPLAKLAHGVIIGGSPWWDEGKKCPTCGQKLPVNATADDRVTFRKQKHADLDRALDGFFQTAIQSGRSMQVILPSDLELKLTVAALSVLCGKTTKEIADHQKISRERTVVSRWLKETRALLQLPPRKPGHRRRSLLQ